MNSITADEILVLYKQIARVFPRISQPNSIEAAQMLASIYSGYTLKELSNAFMSYAKQEDGTPAPADIIKYAQDARYNYRMSHALDNSGVKYDAEGHRLYSCPYCRDTGYMCVKWPEENTEFYTPCVHTKPETMRRFKESGSFGVKVPKWGFGRRLSWVPSGGYFAPTETTPIEVKPKNSDNFFGDFNDWTAETGYLTDDKDLPF